MKDDWLAKIILSIMKSNLFGKTSPPTYIGNQLEKLDEKSSSEGSGGARAKNLSQIHM
jgi:hypothetical protein